MTDRQTRFDSWLLVLRVGLAVFAFGYLSLFVWAAQHAYDTLDHRWQKVPLYALIILGAGMTYDCGKFLLLMPKAQLKVFLLKTVIPIFWVMVVMLITAIVGSIFALRGWPLSVLITIIVGLFVMMFHININPGASASPSPSSSTDNV